MCFLGKKGRRR